MRLNSDPTDRQCFTPFSDLPTSLTELDISTLPRFFQQFPASLTKLHLGSAIVQLPATLKSLTLPFWSGINLEMLSQPLPNGLEELENYSGALRALPKSVRSLSLFGDWNQAANEWLLLDKLETLKFGDKFDRPLHAGIFPSKLTHLEFGKAFNEPLAVGVLPPSLRVLQLSTNFNRRLEAGQLNTGLTALHLGSAFQYPLPPNILPSTLITLFLPVLYNYPLLHKVLPPSLLHLAIPAIYYQTDKNDPSVRNILPASLKWLWIGDYDEADSKQLFQRLVKNPSLTPVYRNFLGDQMNVCRVETSVTEYLATQNNSADASRLSLRGLFIFSNKRPQISGPNQPAA